MTFNQILLQNVIFFLCHLSRLKFSTIFSSKTATNRKQRAPNKQTNKYLHFLNDNELVLVLLIVDVMELVVLINLDRIQKDSV